MNTYIMLLLLPIMLFAETAMKCEAGKCATGNNTMTKKVPKLESTMTTNTKTLSYTKPTIEQLFNVKTVKVKEITTAQTQLNYGYIVAKDSLKIDVTAWYSGFVKELYTDTMYTHVKKGDALVKVYSPEVYKAKQDYLNSINYNATRATPGMLESAKRKLILLGVSQKEIEYIQNERVTDEFTTIYAPISGWIFEKNINQGSAFNTNMKLFQIVNLQEVWMEVKLFQDEIVKLDTLQHFKVKVKGLKETYRAKKSLLYPMLNAKEATATLRLVLDNKKETLKPGMYAKVHASAQSQSRLVIPRTAVMRKSGIWYAFLATAFKGEYEPIVVEVKPLDNKHFEVTKGLHLDDIVVNNALFMMDSDAQINSVY